MLCGLKLACKITTAMSLRSNWADRGRVSKNVISLLFLTFSVSRVYSSDYKLIGFISLECDKTLQEFHDLALYATASYHQQRVLPIVLIPCFRCTFISLGDAMYEHS